MKVLFRVNAGKSPGLGHLTRCIALSEAFYEFNIDSFFLIKSDDCSMISSFLVNEGITQKHYRFLPDVINNFDDVKYISDTYNKEVFSFLILDHYDHDLEYQQRLKNRGIKWAQFDYKANEEILADVVINANISASENDYKNLTSPNTVLCIGCQYAILREKFRKQNSQPEKQRILVAMGGGKYPKEVLQLIRFLVTYYDHNFDIVTRDSQLLNIGKELPNVNIHISPNDLLSIYKRCETAIVAGGVTTYELALLKIPMFIIPFTGNHLPNAKAWHKNNFAMSFDSINSFYNALRQKGVTKLTQQLINKNKNKTFSIDGLGSRRIVAKVLSDFKGV